MNVPHGSDKTKIEYLGKKITLGQYDKLMAKKAKSNAIKSKAK